MLVHKELTRFGRPSFIVLNKLSRNFFFQICYSMITPWPLEEQKHLVHPAVVAAESRKRQNQFPKMKKNKREKKACAPVHDPCYVNDWSAHLYIFFSLKTSRVWKATSIKLSKSITVTMKPWFYLPDSLSFTCVQRVFLHIITALNKLLLTVFQGRRQRPW